MLCVKGFAGDMILSEVEQRIADRHSVLLDEGLSIAESVAEIEASTLESNDPEVAEALADPVFRAWLLGEPHPAAERDRLAAQLKQVQAERDQLAATVGRVEQFGAQLASSPLHACGVYAGQLAKVLRGE